jgi:hypothetical protein
MRPEIERLVHGDEEHSKANLGDPMYHLQRELLGQWLDMTERAMRDEDIDYDTAHRVLRAITYGAMPRTYDSIERMRLIGAMTDHALRQPLGIPHDPRVPRG